MSAIPRARTKTLSCPECSADAEGLTPLHARDGAGHVVVCRKCAAVATWDRARYRGLRTQEWMDLVCDPRWFPVLEERQRVLDKLTSPAGGTKEGGQGG